MSWAVIITDNEVDHATFVAAYRKVFAAHEELGDVAYVDVVPKITALYAADGTKEQIKAMRAPYRGRKNAHKTFLITQRPFCFDSDGVDLCEIDDERDGLVYVLDPAADVSYFTHMGFAGGSQTVFQRRTGESMEDFALSLR